MRDRQLAAEPWCADCNERATVADHAEPHRGDDDLFWNGALISRCRPCHNNKTAREIATRLGASR